MTQTLTPPISTATRPQSGMSRAELDAYKKAFAEDGYVVIKNVVPRDKLAQLHAIIAAEYARQKADGTLFNGGGGLSGHLNCFPGEVARFAYEALKERGVVDLIREIAPQSVREPYVGCNLNLPGSVTQQMHMDRTFRNEFMIANISVVDTDLVNGATDVVPGSHKRFYKYWQWALLGKGSAHKRLPSQAGDVLVRVSNLWHRGMPNHSSQPRPMLAFTWDGGGSPLADPFAENDGKIKFIPNWFAPTRTGRIIERMFVSAPITYKTYRFVNSIFSDKSY
jgi:ectoine hydroxylase-related dioxygenase (phytanoyl-CoA dioxygenase family)